LATWLETRGHQGSNRDRLANNLALQTIISRENSPLDPAVVTIGSIHGGTKRNIIPDEVVLQLTIRTYKEEVRQHILASIDSDRESVAMAAGVPEDRGPNSQSNRERECAVAVQRSELTERLATAIGKASARQHDQIAPVNGE